MWLWIHYTFFMIFLSWGLHGGIHHMFAAMEAPGKWKIEFSPYCSFLFLGPIHGRIHHTYNATEEPGKRKIEYLLFCSFLFLVSIHGRIHHTHAVMEAPGKPYIFRPEMTRWRSTGTCDHLTGLMMPAGTCRGITPWAYEVFSFFVPTNNCYLAVFCKKTVYSRLGPPVLGLLDWGVLAVPFKVCMFHDSSLPAHDAHACLPSLIAPGDLQCWDITSCDYSCPTQNVEASLL